MKLSEHRLPHFRNFIACKSRQKKVERGYFSTLRFFSQPKTLNFSIKIRSKRWRFSVPCPTTWKSRHFLFFLCELSGGNLVIWLGKRHNRWKTSKKEKNEPKKWLQRKNNMQNGENGKIGFFVVCLKITCSPHDSTLFSTVSLMHKLIRVEKFCPLFWPNIW